MSHPIDESLPSSSQPDTDGALNKTGTPETPVTEVPSAEAPTPATSAAVSAPAVPTCSVLPMKKLVSPAPFQWHTRYLSLCAEAGLAPEVLFTFYRAKLQWEKPGAQVPTLEAFVSENRVAGTVVDVERLLNTVKVVAHPKAFPPLVNHPSQQLDDLFDRVITKGHPHGVQALADLYWMEEADVMTMLREHYPHLVFRELSDPQDLLDEIKHFIDKVEDGEQKAEPFHEQALAAVEECWGHLEAPQWQTKLDKLGRQCGFDSMADFRQWADEHVPAVSDWLGRLKKPTQPGIPHFGLQQHQETEDF